MAVKVKKPQEKAAKYSKNRAVFCLVTHDEMAFSEVISNDVACLFSGNLNLVLKRNEDISPRFTRQNILKCLEFFGSLFQVACKRSHPPFKRKRRKVSFQFFLRGGSAVHSLCPRDSPSAVLNAGKALGPKIDEAIDLFTYAAATLHFN